MYIRCRCRRRQRGRLRGALRSAPTGDGDGRRRRRRRPRARTVDACLLLVREDQVDLAPVLLGRGALRRPVGRVIQLIGHLRRPEAAHVAVEQIALDRLAQPGGAAVAIGFPARREHQRAAGGNVRRLGLLRRPPAEARRRLLRVTASTRAALRLIGVRCFMRPSPEPLRHRTAAGSRDSFRRSRRRSRGRCASSRESTRSSAGWAASVEP